MHARDLPKKKKNYAREMTSKALFIMHKAYLGAIISTHITNKKFHKKQPRFYLQQQSE